MDSFLDSCVIINSLQYTDSTDIIKKRCYDYVNVNIKDIILCAHVVDEVKRFIRKKEMQFNEVIKKKENSLYKIGSNEESGILSKEDLLFAEKIYEKVEKDDKNEVKLNLIEEIREIRIRFNIFVKRIKEILKEEINQNLINLLREFITDYADCKVLSSALIAQRTREIFVFITADRHFAPNIYDFAKEDQRFKDYKFPNLKNLLYE